LIPAVEAHAHPHHWGWADLHGWQVLRPLFDDGGFLPWTEGAMSPAGLATVAAEIAVVERRSVLELGSGVSTVVLARLARQLGGRITAVEHHPGWAGWVRRQLRRDGLEAVATVLEAPLVPHPQALAGAPWYNEAALDAVPTRGSSCSWSTGPPATGRAWRSAATRRSRCLPSGSPTVRW
jgi:Methyltransferase domain